MNQIKTIPEELLLEIEKGVDQSKEAHKKELRRVQCRKNERRYYRKHKAKIIEKAVLWQKENREEYNARMRAYHDKNRERNRQYQRDYRLKKK